MNNRQGKIDWYQELGALISSFRRPWFPQTLQASLQKLYPYDYFLLVFYTKNKPLRIIRSDFRDEKIRQALSYFISSTYRADPPWLLHNEGLLKTGIYTMHDLSKQAKHIKTHGWDKIEFLIKDDTELQGFRTKGWPSHLRELCIIIEIDEMQACCISLYKSGLYTGFDYMEHESSIAIKTVMPSLSALMKAYFSAPPGRKYLEQDIEAGIKITGMDTKILSEFFVQFYQINLTKRELDIFVRLLDGHSLVAIADELCISLHTAKTHRRNVYRKAGEGNITKLIGQYIKFKQEQTSH